MKKAYRFVSMLLVFALLVIYAVPLAETEASHTGEDVILLNDNFDEIDENGEFLHWETDGATFTDVYRRHGPGSMEFISEDPESVISASQVVSLKGGHIYTLDGYFHDAMGDNPERVSEVVVYYLDADGQELGSDVIAHYDANTEDESVYKHFEGEFNTPQDAAQVRIYLYGTNYTGFFLYDWFHLNEVGPVPDKPEYVEATFQNGNFDDLDENGDPLHWETDGAGYTDVFRRHGPGSLEFISEDPESVSSASQVFNVTGDYVYNLVGYFHDAMGDNPERFSETVIYYLDANGEEIGSQVLKRFDANTADQSVYKKIEKRFTTPPAAKQARLYLYGSNYTGFFLYDWFQLSEVGYAADLTGQGPPDAPESLTTTLVSGAEVYLRWAAPDGPVTSYVIYRNGQKVGTSPVLTYSDKELTEDTAYSYTIAAVNEFGESEPSSAREIVTDYEVDVTPPGKPTLRADAESSTDIVLRWRAVKDDTRVTDHKLYRNGELIETAESIYMGVYTDTELTPGTTYEYTVVALDAAGNESEISNTVVATTFTDTVNQYVEGMVHLNFYIDEPSANIIYRLGPGYKGQTGLTAKAVVDLNADQEAAVYTEEITNTSKTVVSVPLNDLAVGEYTVELSILEGEQTIWATEDSITIHPEQPANTRVTQVDHDREITILDGEPFYPVGVFGVDEGSLQQIADVGFNTTLRWKGYTASPKYDEEKEPTDSYNVNAVSRWLDAVGDAGLYAFETPVKMAASKYYHAFRDPDWINLYPIHNEVITPGVLATSATHPAVIAYYTYDEPDNFYECCPNDANHLIMQEGVEQWYDVVKEIDPYHPVTTLFAVGLTKNADWRAWDLVAHDYYYTKTDNMSNVYKAFKEFAITADQWNNPFIATPKFEEFSGDRNPLNGIQQRAYFGHIRTPIPETSGQRFGMIRTA